MSIATEFTRIQSDRNTIRNKLVELGMANSTDKLDALAGAIENLINQGAVKVEVREGETYTIPKGYHNGSGTVSGVKGGGNYTLQEKTATPTKKQQNVVPDNGYYGLSGVTVNPIPDAYQDVTSVTASAGDVLTGKVYVTKDGAVTAGEMLNNGAVNATLDATSITYTIPKGYHSGSGKVTLVLETKTVTPTKAAQNITPSSGKVLSKVTVNPIPAAYQDVTGVTATADKVLTGSDFVDAEGTVVSGTMVDHTGDGSIVPLTVERNTYTIPEGYHDGERTVSVALGGTAYVTPTKEQQHIEGSWADNGEGNLIHHGFLNDVYVQPIPNNYQDITVVTASPNDVLEGKYYVSASGVKYEGVMADNGNVSDTIDGFSKTSVTIPAGYTTGGTITLTNDIENALKEI